MDKTNTKRWFIYRVFDTFNEAWDFVLDQSLEESTFYQTFDVSDPLKFYIDFEKENPDPDHWTIQDCIVHILKAIKYILYEDFDKMLPENSVIIYDSSRKGKLSLHFEFQSFYMTDIYSMQTFAQKIQTYLRANDNIAQSPYHSIWKCVDMSVYGVHEHKTQNFRLPFNHKYGKLNVKLPLQNMDIDDCIWNIPDEDITGEIVFLTSIPRSCFLVKYDKPPHLLEKEQQQQQQSKHSSTSIESNTTPLMGEDTIYTKIEEFIASHPEFELVGGTMEGEYIKLRRIQSAPCVVCKDHPTHDNDNAFIHIEKGIPYFDCYRRKQHGGYRKALIKPPKKIVLLNQLKKKSQEKKKKKNNRIELTTEQYTSLEELMYNSETSQVVLPTKKVAMFVDEFNGYNDDNEEGDEDEE